jgi:hypothetical protein
MADQYCKLKPGSFGLAFGVLWAIAVFIMGIVALESTGYAHGFVQALGALYIGYEATFVGSIIGAIWALVDGFIFCAVLAVLYNWFSGCCGCCCKTKED